MEYNVSVSETGDFICVKLIGDIDHKSSKAYLEETKDLLAERHLSEILVDVRKAFNAETMSSNYWFIHDNVRKSGLGKLVKIAILSQPDDHSHEIVATISQNAGFNMHLFQDEDKAISWLLSRN